MKKDLLINYIYGLTLVIFSLIFFDIKIGGKELFWFHMFFNLPHIITSIYIGFLKRKEKPLLSFPFRIFLYVISPLALFLVNPLAANILFLFITFKHVLFQQIKIATTKITGFSKNLYLALILLMSVFFSFSSFSKHIKATGFEQVDLLRSFLIENKYLLYFIIIFSLFFLFKNINKENNLSKKINLIGAVSLLPLMSICYHFGFPIIGYLIIRVSHDLTAFVFYSDYLKLNKKTLSIVPLSFILTATLALLKAPIYITFLLGGIHYYLESFIWKNNKTKN